MADLFFQENSENINSKGKLFKQKVFLIKLYTRKILNHFFVNCYGNALNKGLEVTMYFTMH